MRPNSNMSSLVSGRNRVKTLYETCTTRNRSHGACFRPVRRLQCPSGCAFQRRLCRVQSSQKPLTRLIADHAQPRHFIALDIKKEEGGRPVDAKAFQQCATVRVISRHIDPQSRPLRQTRLHPRIAEGGRFHFAATGAPVGVKSSNTGCLLRFKARSNSSTVWMRLKSRGADCSCALPAWFPNTRSG